MPDSLKAYYPDGEVCQAYYPDYDLDWVVLTDASMSGCGGVLVQLRPNPAGTFVHEPIGVLQPKV